MHSLIEEYLNEVAVSLGPLPVRRRNEEMKEVRQHLLNALVVNQEMGQSEDEAAANAVEHFGAPRELCDNLVWAWRRGEARRDRRSFWSATAWALGLTALLEIVVSPFVKWHRLDPWLQTGPFSLVSIWPIDSLIYFFNGAFDSVCCIALGLALGIASPRKAVAGTALGVSVWTVFVSLWAAFHNPPYPPPALFLSFLVIDSPNVLLTAVGAYLALRCRSGQVQGGGRARQSSPPQTSRSPGNRSG